MLSELVNRYEYHLSKGELISHEKHGDEWFYLTVEKAEERTCLTKHEQLTSLKILKNKGFIEQAEFGLPCRRYFRLCEENILNALGLSKNPSSTPVSRQPPLRSSDNHLSEVRTTAPIYKEPNDDPQKKEGRGQYESTLSSSLFFCAADHEELVKLFENYKFSEETLIYFSKFTKEHLKDAIAAFEQWDKKEGLEEPLGALYKAVKEGWKPRITKEDREKAIIKEKEEIIININKNKTFIEKLIEKYKSYFNTKFGLEISDNCVRLRTETGFQPIELLDVNLKNIVSNYLSIGKGSR
jgi:hypothetical protein